MYYHPTQNDRMEFTIDNVGPVHATKSDLAMNFSSLEGVLNRAPNDVGVKTHRSRLRCWNPLYDQHEDGSVVYGTPDGCT